MFRRLSASNLSPTYGRSALSTTAVRLTLSDISAAAKGKKFAAAAGAVTGGNRGKSPAKKKGPTWRKRTGTVAEMPKAVAVEFETRQAVRELMEMHFLETSKESQRLLDMEAVKEVPTLESDPIGFFRIERQNEKSQNALKWVQLERSGADIKEIEGFKEIAVMDSQALRLDQIKQLHQTMALNQQMLEESTQQSKIDSSAPESALLTTTTKDTLAQHRTGLLEHQQRLEAQKYFATKDDPTGKKAAQLRRRQGIIHTGTTLNVDDLMAEQDEQLENAGAIAQGARSSPGRQTDPSRFISSHSASPGDFAVGDFEDDAWEDTPTTAGGYFTSPAFHEKADTISSSGGVSISNVGNIRTEAPAPRQVPGASVGTGYFTAFNSATAPPASTTPSGGRPTSFSDDEFEDDNSLGSSSFGGDYTYDPELQEEEDSF